jgi:hypothetical protein
MTSQASFSWLALSEAERLGDGEGTRCLANAAESARRSSPYTAGDFENKLCVYQEALGRERRRSA